MSASHSGSLGVAVDACEQGLGRWRQKDGEFKVISTPLQAAGSLGHERLSLTDLSVKESGTHES